MDGVRDKGADHKAEETLTYIFVSKVGIGGILRPASIGPSKPGM